MAVAEYVPTLVGAVADGLYLLESPEFLFVSERVEPDSVDSVHASVTRLDGYSRAARLSFFLWNTSPDEVLLTAVTTGTANLTIGYR